jgi:hypothetical protein
MSRMASDLETSVRKGEWESNHDLAKRLLILLAEASGAWSDTLEQTDVDNFDALRTEITVVEKSGLSGNYNRTNSRRGRGDETALCEFVRLHGNNRRQAEGTA